MKSTTVNISETNKSYNIYVGSDFIHDRIEYYIKENAYFVVDAKVASLYRNIIPQNSSNVFIFQANEKTKTLSSVE